MTTMCDNFFGLPQGVVRLGDIRALSPFALKLLVALWHDSERYSTRELTRTVAELQELIGGSRTSHTKARTELTQSGLLVAQSCGAEGFIFHLCNPETRKPWPFHPKSKLEYARKGKAPGVTAASPMTPAHVPGPAAMQEAETDFNYGYNNSQQKTTTPSDQPCNPLVTWDKIR